MPGYSEWDQAPYGDPCIFGGVAYDAIPQPLERDPSVRASRVSMRSGRVVVMVPVAEDGAELQSGGAWSWRFPLLADHEAFWYRLRRASVRGEVSDWVDYGYDLAEWIGVAGSTSYALVRAPAAAVVTGFPAANYPPAVFVDGVAVTVVAGAPSAGEAQVTETALVLGDASVGGEVIELRYVPRYRVVVSGVPESLSAFHDLSTQIVLTEAQE